MNPVRLFSYLGNLTMHLLMFLFMGELSYPLLIAFLVVSWALGFLLCKIVFKKLFNPQSLNLLAVICGLMLCPIIMTLLIWVIVSVF